MVSTTEAQRARKAVVSELVQASASMACEWTSSQVDRRNYLYVYRTYYIGIGSRKCRAPYVGLCCSGFVTPCTVSQRVRAPSKPESAVHRSHRVPVHVAVLHAAPLLQRSAHHSQRHRHQWSWRFWGSGKWLFFIRWLLIPK